MIAALVAIGLWATLAAVTVDALAGMPPFRLLLWSMAFAAPTLLITELARGRRAVDAFRMPPLLLPIGVLGILGANGLLYLALRLAPVVEANLLNYLWPLFIVLAAPFVVGERLTIAVVAGVSLGFLGAVLVVTNGRAVSLSTDHLAGYACALGAALSWSIFSLALKRYGAAAAGRMPAFMLASLLGALALALIEGTAAPPQGRALLACAWIGVGPLGLAYTAWDEAMRSSGAARIGVLSYLTPLLSTLVLALAHDKPLTGVTWLGMALIIVGAALPGLTRRRPPV